MKKFIPLRIKTLLLKWWQFQMFLIYLKTNPLIRSQMSNPKSIPIIIINFNQLYFLEKLVKSLCIRQFENIVIIDNFSTYPPLQQYYKTLKGVTVEYMEKNYGHKVFFENKYLYEKYGKGFYVVTDADILLNKDLPDDFMATILTVLIKEFTNINKVGFALDIENIPDYYTLKNKVQNWESQFWKNKYSDKPQAYKAYIDTTFALYKPGYPNRFNNQYFYEGIRLAADFTATHGGWYLDLLNMTDEQKYYQDTSTAASSWLLQKDGSLYPEYYARYS